MQPTQSNQNLLPPDAESPQFGFIGEHVQWLRRTWNEGGVGIKIGLACLIAGECLLGVATVFGVPVLGIAFYELHRQNSIPLKDRNVTKLDSESPQTSDINKIGVSKLTDSPKEEPMSEEKPTSQKPPLNQLSGEPSPTREKPSPYNGKPLDSEFSPTSSTPVPSVEIATAPPPFQMDKFMDAIRKGKLEKVREFFEKYEINLTVKGKNGLTPLHLAASLGHADIVKLLLEKNAPLDATAGDLGRTPLHFAVKNNRLETVIMLLEKNAPLELKDKENKTPLHIAAITGNTDIVKVLLEKNASLDSQDTNGNTPFHLAVSEGKIDVVKFLVEQKNVSLDSKNNQGNTPLHLAAIEGKTDCVKFLLEKKAPIDAKNNQNSTPFHSALHSYDDKAIHSLIRTFIDSCPDLIDAQNEHGNTALHLIAYSSGVFDREFIIHYLLSKGASVTISNKQGDTPLHNAIKAQYDFGDKIPLLLLEKGASLEAKNNKGETPLHTAASHNKTSVFNSLLAKGASTDCKDSEGNTLFSSAAQHGFLGIAKILLQKTPELIDQPNTAGLTPLQLASKCSNTKDRSEMMKFLIQNNVNLNQNIDGELLIHWAFQTDGCSEVLNEVIERTENLNEPDKMGYTLLGKAARDGKLPLVEKLLGKKALVNYGKLTPLQLAAEKHSSHSDRTKIILHLIRAGKADVNLDVIGDPFIHWAYDNNRNIFNTTLPLVSNINVTNKEGYSLLGKAVSNGKLDDVSLLLKNYGADLNVGRKDQTPLQLAAELFSKIFHKDDANKIINLLIEKGADVDKNPIQIDRNEEPFIHWAYLNLNCKDTLKLVLDRTKDINALNSQKYSVLGKAARDGKLDVVTLCLEHKADINIGGIKDFANKTPLQLAVERFSTNFMQEDANKIINLLIEKGADVDKNPIQIDRKEEPFIHWAYLNQNCKDTLKLVLDRTKDINALNSQKYSVLGKAARDGKLDVVTLCLEHKADINIGGIKDFANKTPLQLAVERFSTNFMPEDANKIINLLIEKGADVDNNPIQIDRTEEPFIHWAYLNPNCKDTLKLVLERTKDINALNSQKYSVLGKAVSDGNVGVVSLCLYYKADINIGGIKDFAKKSPLQLAVDYFSSSSYYQEKATQIINLLIEKGADADNTSGRIDNKNEPFIHWVYKNKPKGTLELVIKLCHKIDAPNTDGKTLLDTAIKFHEDIFSRTNGEIIRLLIEKGADISKVTSLPKNETLFQWASKGSDNYRKPVLEALQKKGINS